MPKYIKYLVLLGVGVLTLLLTNIPDQTILLAYHNQTQNKSRLLFKKSEKNLNSDRILAPAIHNFESTPGVASMNKLLSSKLSTVSKPKRSTATLTSKPPNYEKYKNPQYPDTVILYNRVPKTGSTTFANIANDMAKLNKFWCININSTVIPGQSYRVVFLKRYVYRKHAFGAMKGHFGVKTGYFRSF